MSKETGVPGNPPAEISPPGHGIPRKFALPGNGFPRNIALFRNFALPLLQVVAWDEQEFFHACFTRCLRISQHENSKTGLGSRLPVFDILGF